LGATLASFNACRCFLLFIDETNYDRPSNNNGRPQTAPRRNSTSQATVRNAPSASTQGNHHNLRTGLLIDSLVAANVLLSLTELSRSDLSFRLSNVFE